LSGTNSRHTLYKEEEHISVKVNMLCLAPAQHPRQPPGQHTHPDAEREPGM